MFAFHCQFVTLHWNKFPDQELDGVLITNYFPDWESDIRINLSLIQICEEIDVIVQFHKKQFHQKISFKRLKIQ